MEKDKLQTVIIDDEPNAVKHLALLLEEHCSNVKIAGIAHSAAEGIELIKQSKPDLILLDIEMPGADGFEMLRRIPERDFDVIFITAYNDYAINAFKVSAVDYVLKPINMLKLKTAIDRVYDNHFKQKGSYKKYDVLMENLQSKIPDKIVIASTEGMEFINVKDIIRIEGERNYSRIFTTDGKAIVTSKNLMEYQRMLTHKYFFRPHKSYIINILHIKHFNHRTRSGELTMTDGSVIIVSRDKKSDFLEFIRREFDSIL